MFKRVLSWTERFERCCIGRVRRRPPRPSRPAGPSSTRRCGSSAAAATTAPRCARSRRRPGCRWATPTTTSAPRSTWSRRSTTSSRSSTPRRRRGCSPREPASPRGWRACCSRGWTWRRRTTSSPGSSSERRRPDQPALAVQRGVGAGPRRQHRALRDACSTGRTPRSHRRCARELPELLWLLQMGVGAVLGVRREPGPGAQPRLLVRRLVPIVDRLVRLSRLPVVRGIVDDVVGLMRELRS